MDYDLLIPLIALALAALALAWRMGWIDALTAVLIAVKAVAVAWLLSRGREPSGDDDVTHKPSDLTNPPDERARPDEISEDIQADVDVVGMSDPGDLADWLNDRAGDGPGDDLPEDASDANSELLDVEW